MKNNKILIGVIVGLILIIGGLCYGLFRVNNKLVNNNTIHCVMSDSDGTMEFFYDYRDGEIYRYSIISTFSYKDSVNVDAYKLGVERYNEKYKGVVEKFWTDYNTCVTMEIFNFDLLSDEEFQETMYMSRSKFKELSRQDIIDSFVPMMNDGTFECN